MNLRSPFVVLALVLAIGAVLDCVSLVTDDVDAKRTVASARP